MRKRQLKKNKNSSLIKNNPHLFGLNRAMTREVRRQYFIGINKPSHDARTVDGMKNILQWRFRLAVAMGHIYEQACLKMLMGGFDLYVQTSRTATVKSRRDIVIIEKQLNAYDELSKKLEKDVRRIITKRNGDL